MRSHANMSLRAGEGASVTCHTYPDTAPILAVDLPGGTWLSISLADRKAPVSEQAVAFARALVQSAEQFVAEAERLHGLPSAQDAAA